MQTFTMLRDAVVRVSKKFTTPTKRDVNPKPVAVLTVDDKFEAEFPDTSRVSRALMFTSEEELSKRLTGGHYLFNQSGKLIDWRDGDYNGFVHGDEAIKRLTETIGSTDIQRIGPTQMRHMQFNNTVHSRDMGLFTEWGENKIAIPKFGDGGLFTTHVNFSWNPFSEFVNTILYVKRLICANGMTGVTSWLNSKIPLVNIWKENLDIAEKQIQRKVEDRLQTRMVELAKTHASIADVQLLCDHAYNRLSEHNGKATNGEMETLRNIISKTNPILHLNQQYRPSVFPDKRRAAQLPSHLSQFSAFNIATELATHTKEVTKSSDFALMKFANQMIFNNVDMVSRAARYSKVLQSPFNSPELAFHGKTH